MPPKFSFCVFSCKKLAPSKDEPVRLRLASVCQRYIGRIYFLKEGSHRKVSPKSTVLIYLFIFFYENNKQTSLFLYYNHMYIVSVGPGKTPRFVLPRIPTYLLSDSHAVLRYIARPSRRCLSRGMIRERVRRAPPLRLWRGARNPSGRKRARHFHGRRSGWTAARRWVAAAAGGPPRNRSSVAMRIRVILAAHRRSREKSAKRPSRSEHRHHSHLQRAAGRV